jgi:hypothetical protein
VSLLNDGDELIATLSFGPSNDHTRSRLYIMPGLGDVNPSECHTRFKQAVGSLI